MTEPISRAVLGVPEKLAARYKTLVSRMSARTITCTAYPTPTDGSGAYAISLPSAANVTPFPVREGSAWDRSMQFLGVHDGAILTLRRPPELASLVQIATSVPQVAPLSPITWYGTVRIRRTSLAPTNRGLLFLVPKATWNPPASLLESGRIHLLAIYHYIPIPNTTEHMLVLHLPALTPDLFQTPIA
jgi:hypothetical protein